MAGVTSEYREKLRNVKREFIEHLSDAIEPYTEVWALKTHVEVSRLNYNSLVCDVCMKDSTIYHFMVESMSYPQIMHSIAIYLEGDIPMHHLYTEHDAKVEGYFPRKEKTHETQK